LLFALAAAAALGALDPAGGSSLPARALAQQDWRKEFDDVCSKTQDAMALSLEELRTLLARCDKLKPVLEKLEESQRKVFTRRLQACRDLYQFVLETREKP
jgi:hypothetical protein